MEPGQKAEMEAEVEARRAAEEATAAHLPAPQAGNRVAVAAVVATVEG